ncbi:phosphate transport system regulatory protein PhoU [Bacillus sp. 7586-K]|uniref:Phosphate-specific transport system accessory protein PhoU n=1 Tax=Metabacillus niabensis TaxID=324854 RepID=A0ABT9Z005_9BACI|nr:phosphate signaling complex protein PhoU [Metabacillus niabensis]MDQ0225360.1 phosphate transport system protein [Metabacillus niabensis]PAD71105.1 phosphate transport system regulatory protein PhoU [Bacillus sp. 7586-K]
MVTRENFENNLQELQAKLTMMGELAVASINKSFDAFKNHDIELALKVIEEDSVVDNLETEINQFIVWLMAKEQPVARDLRRIIGVLKISSEIERIADFGVNIAKATIKIGTSNSQVDDTNLDQMKEISITMMHKALQSFFEGNMVLVKEVADLDDNVDKLYGETYKMLTSHLKENPEETEQLVQLLLINRFLERTADHITNIAESAAYLIKGQIYDLNS